MRAHGNAIRAGLLLALVSGLTLATGAMFGQLAFLMSIVVACALCAYLYVVGPTVSLRAMHARRITELEQPGLFRLVRELSTAARQPMPTLYLSPTKAPNAFATGHGPHHAAICCTAGLLELLDERALRAVLAQQLARVYSRDVLVSSIAGALGAAITGLAGFGYLLGFAGQSDGGRRSGADADANGGDANGGGANGGGANGGGPRRTRVVDALYSVLNPIAAALIRLGVSRTADLRADADGAVICGDAPALAHALVTVERGAAAAPLPPDPELATHAHAMLLCPFRADEQIARTFRTHPPVAERVALLRAPGT